MIADMEFHMKTCCRNRLVSLLGILTLGLTAVAAWAQNAPPAPANPALNSATVSLPLSDLRGLMDKTDPNKAPVEYVLSQSRVSAKVEGKTAATTSTMEVALLTVGWALIPLGPAVGVLQVTVDDKPASIVQRGPTLFLLLDGKTTRKASVQVIGERKPIADGPLTRLELPLPPAPLVSVSASVDRVGLDVKAVSGSAVKIIEDKDQTRLTAGYQGDQTATITWRAKPAAGMAAAAKLVPSTLTRVAIGRGVVRYLAQIHYDIPQGEAETLKLTLPEGVEFTSATGNQVRDTQVVTAPADKSRTLVVTLAEPARDGYVLNVVYEQRFDEKQGVPTVALLRHPEAATDAGFIGLEVRGGGYELVPTVAGANRIDVRELPVGLWSSAHSPLLFGYRYDTPKDVKIALGLTKHADVDVLVAMSDVAEAATTVTPDGKTITKVMYVTRNNLKQFMTLKLPEGAQLWSAFVDDRPVTPVKSAKGEILLPLKKSDTVAADDDTSYRAQREKRRAEGDSDRMAVLREKQARQAMEEEPADLKPYDVEIVYVLPAVKLEDKGQLKLGLPQSDVPVGKLAWAVFLPANLRVVDTQGNLSEVSQFSLGFRHFAEAAWAKQRTKDLQKAADAMQSLQQAQAELAKAVGEKAKAEGVLPVRVEIPVSGEISRFEKLLTVDEAPAMTLIYNRRAN